MLKHVLMGALATTALTGELTAKDAPAPAAAAPAATAAPAPPAELSQLDFFVGTWNCAGKTFATPMGPEHATTATVHSARAVGNRWVHTTYDENKTAANPVPYHAAVYWTYDAGRKAFVQSCVDAFGGYCQQTSQGWNGDVFGFEGSGYADGKQGMFRDTFTKKDVSTLVHAGEMQGEDKQWIKLDEETCHRAK